MVRRSPPGAVERRQVQRRLQAQLIKKLFDTGITIVAGTDSQPFFYVSELETYERAGIPAPNVLQIATIVPARVMNEDRDYGSIVVGKVADLVIVDGQPATRISDLRRAETVIRAGRVYDVRELYEVVGVIPR